MLKILLNIVAVLLILGGGVLVPTGDQCPSWQFHDRPTAMGTVWWNFYYRWNYFARFSQAT